MTVAFIRVGRRPGHMAFCGRFGTKQCLQRTAIVLAIAKEI